MPARLKELKRGLRRRSGAFLDDALNGPAPSLKRIAAPTLCHADMFFIDYGIARALYGNRHRIADDIWRSAQPTPRHLRSAARQGIKTVINLRTEQSFGTRWLEEKACRDNGLKLVDVVLRSRAAPSLQELRAVRETLDRVEFPILVHCKSGSDRAGMMSALVLHLKKGVPIAEAKKQLALRYGHIRQADTGVLDYVFDRYLEDNAKEPIAFWDWVESRYDPAEINRTFRATGWANRIVNGILGRE